MYPVNHEASGLIPGDAATLPADEGVESDFDPICREGNLDDLADVGSTEVGRSLENEVFEFLCEFANGLNRSLVSSNSSDPIASIAEAYRSLRNRDSETINSANSRTRSSSVDAAASFFANTSCRSIAA